MLTSSKWMERKGKRTLSKKNMTSFFQNFELKIPALFKLQVAGSLLYARFTQVPIFEDTSSSVYKHAFVLMDY